MREKSFDKGELIFREGAEGNEAFRILEGRIEISIHVSGQGDVPLGHLVPGDIFGEMALLDGEPRTASIRTVQPTQLLRLEQEPFYELMDDRIEIARGIIHVLLQRLRLRTNDVHRLQAQLADMKLERGLG